jgi:integrase
VHVSLFRRNERWWARYHRDGRVFRVSLRTSNKKVAEDARLDLEVSLRRGPPVAAPTSAPAPVPIAPQAPVVTIQAFVNEHRDYSLSHKRPKTHATDTGRLKEFLDSLDVKELALVTTSHVSRFLTRKTLKDKISPTTVLRYRETLHAFFEYAKRLGYVPVNPVSAVPRPRIPDRDVQFLTLEDIDKLLSVVAGDRIAPLVATLIFAGLRREEACWLTRGDLELDSKTPTIRVRAKTVGGVSWMPKTKRNRTVPISSRLLTILRGATHAHSTWVFASPQGNRWDPDNLSAHFRTLMKRAGLSWNFLDLRHTFGSQLASNGVSLLKIASLMGNSPAIAQRHYIRLVPEDMQLDVEFPTLTSTGQQTSEIQNNVDAHQPEPPKAAA